ncbi:MAG: hypothetical protein AAFZ15_19300 [Bacteroidota bacterium]
MPKKRKPKVTSYDDLSAKSTRELLAYLKRLHQCEDSFEQSDWDVNIDLQEKEIIYFKNTEKWEQAYQMVKSILSTREHIERPPSKKQKIKSS